MEHLLSYSPNPANHANTAHGYLALGARRVADTVDEPTERIESEFIAVSDLLRLIESGEFPNAIHIPAVYVALRRLGLLDFREPAPPA